MQRMPWWALSLAGAVLGGALGWLAGVVWFEMFAPPSAGDLGSDFQGVATVFRGSVGGAVTGGLTGALLRRAATVGGVVRVLAGSLATGCSFVVGLSYVGDLTNADGPGSRWSYVGFAALPLSIVLGVLLVRGTGHERRADRQRRGPPE